MQVFSLICANGLGHYRRCIAVLERLKRRVPEAQFSVWCAEWQIERMRDWPAARRFWADRSVRVGSPAGPQVRWFSDASAYTNGSLLSWMGELRQMPELRDADFVVSDNLAGILELRPDATLLGSFLWSDVLLSAFPESNEVATFAAHEMRLLERFRPPMICVGDAVMPAVLELTSAIRVGWMTEERATSRVRPPTRSIAVLGGATGVAAALLAEAALQLVNLGRPNVRVDAAIRDLLPEDARSQTVPFKYLREEFRDTRAILCRPGMGTVTECVAYRVPSIAVYEGNNSEMAFLAQRTEALGIGIDLGTGPPDAARVRVGLGRAAMIAAGEIGDSPFDQLPTGGLDEAAAFLCNLIRESILRPRKR